MNMDYKSKIDKTELFVLDMDGTIYLGDKPLKGAIEFCERIIQSGRKLMYFTNNASKNPQNYLDKLSRLGFPSQREMIVTSGDVTSAYLNRYHKGEPVYVVGTPELENSFRKSNIPMVKCGEPADIVVVSFDLTLTYEKLSHACTLIRNGAKFYSTHPDINCPTENGFIPDSGAICGAIELSTGVSPRYFGKPYSETADMIEQIAGIDRSRISMVGDRLYTDIALGKQNGINAILVMSGETTPEMLSQAQEQQQPDMVLDGVYEITPML